MPQLKSVEILERQPQIRLQLTFVPASQSCRNRVYVMEENDFTVIISMAVHFLSFHRASWFGISLKITKGLLIDRQLMLWWSSILLAGA